MAVWKHWHNDLTCIIHCVNVFMLLLEPRSICFSYPSIHRDWSGGKFEKLIASIDQSSSRSKQSGYRNLKSLKLSKCGVSAQNWNAFEAQDWFKAHKLVCQLWAPLIIESFATSCPLFSGLHSCPHWLSWYRKLQSFITEKLQWLSAELRDEALRHGGTDANGWRKWNMTKLHDLDQETECLQPSENPHDRANIDRYVIELCRLLLPWLEACVMDQLDSLIWQLWFLGQLHLRKTKLKSSPANSFRFSDAARLSPYYIYIGFIPSVVSVWLQDYLPVQK